MPNNIKLIKYKYFSCNTTSLFTPPSDVVVITPFPLYSYQRVCVSSPIVLLFQLLFMQYDQYAIKCVILTKCYLSSAFFPFPIKLCFIIQYFLTHITQVTSLIITFYPTSNKFFSLRFFQSSIC